MQWPLDGVCGRFNLNFILMPAEMVAWRSSYNQTELQFASKYIDLRLLLGGRGSVGRLRWGHSFCCWRSSWSSELSINSQLLVDVTFSTELVIWQYDRLSIFPLINTLFWRPKYNKQNKYIKTDISLPYATLLAYQFKSPYLFIWQRL